MPSEIMPIGVWGWLCAAASVALLLSGLAAWAMDGWVTRRRRRADR